MMYVVSELFFGDLCLISLYLFFILCQFVFYLLSSSDFVWAVFAK